MTAMMFCNLPTSMSRDAFIESFGGIYEHSAWVAERAWDTGLNASDDTVEGLAHTLARIVDAAGDDAGRQLILEHPDLAGKAAIAGELTDSSTSEQASAGLDQCTPAQFERFTQLNAQYRARFDMPFIMAVRGSSREAILAAFDARLHNSPEAEYATAIEQIHKIALLRLTALAESPTDG
ncbi:MAG: 2-oxo-4-hydroxy-4-carboxy-5-ureidoimidazoline decarboxylase [Pseudomonadota bacterium]